MNAASFYPVFLQCQKITIDSRTIAKDDLFFAFSGKTFNAATLAKDAIEKGARAVIVEQKEFENADENIFYVENTLDFLQELATYHRSQLEIPIIALTGSNGKTTTKEIMHAVLSQKYSVQYTFGNLNNHIGVPLTILSIKPEHEVAVIEMGANHQKEIEMLCGFAKPTIGYITNFGKAHLEGFGGVEGVIKGKSELYDYLKDRSETILIDENDPIQAQKTENYRSTITFGTSKSDYQFKQFSEGNLVGLEFNGETALSNLTGSYNFTNLCAAASLGFHFGLSFNQIKYAVENYIPTNMRSQVLKKAGKTFVLDTYNANPSSMIESLTNFSTFEGTKAIIIGDMLELGLEAKQEHQLILELARSFDFDEIITVGENFQNVNRSERSFATSAELSEYLKGNQISAKNILLKASRGIALENVLEFIN